MKEKIIICEMKFWDEKSQNCLFKFGHRLKIVLQICTRALTVLVVLKFGILFFVNITKSDF